MGSPKIKVNKKRYLDYMEEISKSIINEYYQFTDGYRVLMLVSRKKDGGENNIYRKLISKDREEFKECIIKLINKAKNLEQPFRIYSSVNNRDIEGAIRIFKKRQLDKDYEDDEARHYFYRDIKNRFISSLMKPRARNESNFLVDIDDEDEMGVEDSIEALEEHTDIIAQYKTKNGSHVVTKPFNYNLLPDELASKVDKDGQLLLFNN